MDFESWNTRYEGRGLVWTAVPNQFLVAEVATLAPGRALDLGCGEGRNAVWLAEQGWEVTAVDFSEMGIAKGKELAFKSEVEVTWVIEDLNRYEPSVGAFDLVIDFYIHSPPDQRTALLIKAAKAVAAGGTMLVVGHDLTNLESGYGGPQDAALLYSADDVAAALTELKVVKAQRVRRVVESDGRQHTAIDTLVRAERPVDPQTEAGTVSQ